MKKKAISLLSGGLDSLLASRIVQDLGIEVVGLHFTSPLCNALKDDQGEKALRSGKELSIGVIVQDKGEAYLDVIRSPRFGYGKNMNPCIDCRIYMLRLTRKIMEAEGASFVVTGEVLGQRPMSQQRETINLIEKESGLNGLILRPLSARLFPPTVAEEEGIVDRERLFDVSGRSRRRQYAMTLEYGLKEYAAPGGGCLLTDAIFSRKLRDFLNNDRSFTTKDMGLLRLGRHFRFQGTRFVFGRNQEENEYLEGFRADPYTLIRPADFTGPSGIAKGRLDNPLLTFAAAVMNRYGKNDHSVVTLEVFDGERRELVLEPGTIDTETYRIKET
jgi:tRNA-uridine 2-sulfurtransferase